MQFRSTKGKTNLTSFKDAILSCLPEDGGLFVPDTVPDLRQYFLHMDEDTSFNELVALLTPLLFKTCLNPVSAVSAVRSAFNFEPKLTRLNEKISILNLYSGPTGVFKDFGIAFMSAILEEIIEDKRIMILAAARPDTGVSMAHAFSERKNISLVLLYPSGQIRGLDASSFVQNGGNIIPIQIKGTFDDCQRLVVDTILDREFSKRYNITSLNSINPGRLLPQAFYYLYAFIQIKNFITGDLIFSVPSGNFGNIISGLYAWKFGLPVNGFIAAMNRNNSMGDYIKGLPSEAAFKHSPLVVTKSPAMDVSFPLNYERLSSFYNEAPAVMRNMVLPNSIDDETTIETIKTVHGKYGIFIDPHTAVAFAAALKTGGYAHTVVLASGDPARSAGTIKEATGKNIDIPANLFMLNKKCSPVAVIQPELEAFESAIVSCL